MFFFVRFFENFYYIEHECRLLFIRNGITLLCGGGGRGGNEIANANYSIPKAIQSQWQNNGRLPG